MSCFYKGISLCLERPGGEPSGLGHSTRGAEEFNGRVRDRIGCGLFAQNHQAGKDRFGKHYFKSFGCHASMSRTWIMGNV